MKKKVEWPILAVSDLHLTDREDDAYRWELFPWLKRAIVKYNVGDVLVLGDVTDFKDNHSAVLVTAIVDSLVDLTETGCRIHILMGNHDCIDPEIPYLGFLQYIPNLYYYTKPRVVELESIGEEALFLPHTRDYVKDWEGLSFDYRYVFAHATITGCKGSNGVSLSGIPKTEFLDREDAPDAVISGDIHVPQKMAKGAIEYVGSPYRIRFGDKFTGRCLLLDGNGNRESIYPGGMQKHTLVIRHAEDLGKYADEVKPGDQVKVRIRIKLSEMSEWSNTKQEVRNYCSDSEWDLRDIEMKLVKRSKLKQVVEEKKREKLDVVDKGNVLDSFCDSAGIGDDVADVGHDIVEQEDEARKSRD